MAVGVALIAALIMVSGCIPDVQDAARDLPAYSSSPDVPPPTPTGPSPYNFAYVPGPNGTVAVMKIQAATGQITHNGSVKAFETNAANVPVAHPSGRFLYATSDAGVFVFAVNPVTGALTQSGALVPIPGGPALLMVDPTGNYLLVTSQQLNASGGLWIFHIDQGSGYPSAILGSPYAVNPSLQTTIGLAFNAAAQVIYVADQTAGSVMSYRLNSDGTLTTLQPGVPTAPGGGPIGLTLHPSGNYLYAVNFIAAGIDVYTVAADGTLAGPTTGSIALTALQQPLNFTIHPSGLFGYTANSGTSFDSVTLVSINPSTGALTRVTDIPTGNGIVPAVPTVLSIDPAGAFAYVLNSASAEVVQFSIDQPTGLLTPVNRVNVTLGSQFIAIVPPQAPVDLVPRLVFALGEISGSLQMFLIDPASGALTFAASAGTGLSPQGIAVHPCGCMVYVVNNGSSTISGYYVDADAGALAPIGTFLMGGGTAVPTTIAVEPSGRYLYVGDPTSGFLTTFTITPGTGVLTGETAILDSLFPQGMTVDPTGQYLVLADVDGLSATNANVYGIDSVLGSLSLLASQTSAGGASGAIGLAVDPSGRFFFAPNGLTADLSAFSWEQIGPALSAQPSTFPAPFGMTAVAAHPNGRYVYAVVSAAGVNTVTAYTIDPSSTPPGNLIQIQTGVQVGPLTQSAGVDPTGRFLYVASQDPFGTISVLSIDPATGFLTPAGSTQLGDEAFGLVTWGALRPAAPGVLCPGGCGGVISTW